ncbi:MAG: hypothetical protein QOJ53_1437 [Sphingomonadales bacterium]|nr:hypothetical protein [Sphingomonadales bacterium]
MAKSRSGAPRRRYVRFTRWRRRRFFALLEESGCVRLACELSGVGMGCIYRLRRTEPGFVAKMAAAAADAVFLGHLRMTGNASASARAAGFTPKSAWNRRERLPSFARAWDAALEEAERRLNGRLTAEALKGSWGMEPGAFEAPEPETFDVDQALRLLTYGKSSAPGGIDGTSGAPRIPACDRCRTMQGIRRRSAPVLTLFGAIRRPRTSRYRGEAIGTDVFSLDF